LGNGLGVLGVSAPGRM